MRNALILVVTLILIIAFTGIATAQKIELTPQMKAWEPVLGKWSGAGESKDNPTGKWTKSSLEVETRSGGFYVENHWKVVREGKENLGVELFGYEPLKKCYVAIGFGDDGSWSSTIPSMGWDGTTLNFNKTITTADGKVLIIRG